MNETLQFGVSLQLQVVLSDNMWYTNGMIDTQGQPDLGDHGGPLR